MSAIPGGSLNLETLVVRIVADATQFNTVVSSVESRITSMVASIQQQGMLMANTFSIMAVSVFGGALKAYAEFDQAITKTMLRMDNMAPGTRKYLEKSIFDLTSGSTISPTEVANSLAILGASGRTATQSLAEMRNMMQFATATGTELGDVTRRLIELQTALGMHSGDATQDLKNQERIMNVLAKTQSMTEEPMQQMLSSFFGKSGLGGGSVAGSTFQKMGLDIEHVVGMMVVMSKQGMKGQEVGTVLVRTLLEVSNAATVHREAWESILGKEGVFKEGKIRPIVEILALLQDQMKNMSDRAKSMTFSTLGVGSPAVAGALNMLIQSPELMNQVTQRLYDVDGTFRRLADITLGTFSSQLKITINLIRQLLIEIGSYLAPAVLYLNQQLDIGIRYWNGMNEGIKQVIVTGAGLYASLGIAALLIRTIPAVLYSVLGPIRAIYATAISLFAALFSWTGLIVGAAALILVVYAQMTVGIDKVLEKAKELSLQAVGFLYNIRENWPILRDWLTAEWQNVLMDMLQILKAFTINGAQIIWAFIKGFQPFYDWLGKEWEHLWADAGYIIGVAMTHIINLQYRMWTLFIEWLAEPSTWAGIGKAIMGILIIVGEATFGMIRGLGEAISDFFIDVKRKQEMAEGKTPIDPLLKKNAQDLEFAKMNLKSAETNLKMIADMQDKVAKSAGIPMRGDFKPNEWDWITNLMKQGGTAKDLLDKEVAKQTSFLKADQKAVDELEARRKLFLKEQQAFGSGGDYFKDVKAMQDKLSGKVGGAGGFGERLSNIIKDELDSAVKQVKAHKFETNWFDPAVMWQSIKETMQKEMKAAPNLLEGFVSSITKLPKFMLDLPSGDIGKLIENILPQFDKLKDMHAPDIHFPFDPSKAGYEFKQMDLRRFILQGQPGSDPRLARPVQEVHDKGVEKKLEELKKELQGNGGVGR